MKNKLHLFFKIFIFSFAFAVFGQEPSKSKNISNYVDYYALNRETLFLHLNKTALILNEDLWLAAYVWNSKIDLPNSETVNLKVEIFKENGIHIDTKTLYISNGKGSGYIRLDPKIYSPGNYFLRASTGYMKNFEEDLSFMQSFKVLGQEFALDQKIREYDLQVLPEGGHLLAGSINSVGVKLIDDLGAGAVFYDARVLNSRNEKVTSFSSNRFGLSRFFFTPIPDEQYRVVLATNTGEKIERLLPQAKEEGINLINTIRNDEHHLSIKTNQKTRRLLKNKKFLLAVHKNGNIREYEFSFPYDQLEVNIFMKKNSLFAGVNTITIFDPNLQPVLERMVYNDRKIKRSRITGDILSVENDSLRIELQTAPNNFRSSLSISVLPSQTKAYNPEHNILSAFHLNPYIKGHIDQAGYYFNPEKDPRQLYNLDLLLLSQGWSKYDWSSSFKRIPEEIESHEIGFTIRGEVMNNKRKQNSIFVASDDVGLFEIVTLEQNGSFNLERVFLKDSTKISYGLISDRNQKVSIPSVNATVYPKKEWRNLDHLIFFARKKEYNEIANAPEAFPNSGNVLDTVMISVEKRKDPIFNPDLQTHARGIEITEEIADRFYHIADYIATKGFQVRKMQGQLEIRSYKMSTVALPAYGDKKGRTASSNVLLYLNGAPMGNNASFLNGLMSSDVESIVINQLGHGEGMFGVNGVIKINLKKGAFKRKRTETMRQIIANNGYAPNKEFYSPRYKNYNSTAFEHYGVIDWKPSVVPDMTGKAEIRIPNRGAATLFIEGMGSDGI